MTWFVYLSRVNNFLTVENSLKNEFKNFFNELILWKRRPTQFEDQIITTSVKVTWYLSFYAKTRMLIVKLDIPILFITNAENDLLSLLKTLNLIILKVIKKILYLKMLLKIGKINTSTFSRIHANILWQLHMPAQINLSLSKILSSLIYSHLKPRPCSINWWMPKNGYNINDVMKLTMEINVNQSYIKNSH